MSLSRRRWSNDFMDSLIDFQSRDSNSINKTILYDSLESKKIEISIDSLDNKCIDVRSMLFVQNDLTTFSQESVKENSSPNILMSDSKNTLRKSRSFNNFANFNVQDNTLNKDLNSRLTLDDIVNINMNITEKNISDTNEFLTLASNQINHLNNLNESLRENITSSSCNEIVEESYCKLNDKKKLNTQSIKNKCIERPNTSLDIKIIKPLSCNSNTQISLKRKSVEQLVNQSPIETLKKDKVNQKFFSSPLQFSPSDQEMITEMNKPDIWDTLLALEQALSPVEEKAPNFEDCSQEHPHILSRLSQKFKKTPTRFTEKLVSIIEDSIISESPIKQYSGDNSGISLHRITGEFRKLCKFIEDESMPEWAPSLINMTGSCFENTPTPENEIISTNFNANPKNILKLINDTPTHKTTPKVSKSFQTPKNKIISNVNSPVNRYTPTADKSFEYWETVCNIMCDNKVNTKKNIKHNLIMSESSKLSMNEMLTICERQLASLDDSSVDIRSSEPCKKVDNHIKLKIDQVPRSKSESKIIFKNNEKRNQTSNEHKDEKRTKKILDNEYELANKHHNLKINNAFKSQNNINLEQNIEKVQDFELLDKKDLSQNDEEIFEDFEFLPNSPKKEQRELMENPYSEKAQNCSLLIELVKRRQRCLDTAKLMLEIDKEDPITNEDSECLQTLYKLGIQNKTFAEVEEDTKFLNTLSQCIDYKNYISGKSKPLVNMLNEFNSPNDLKNKATSVLRSKQFNKHSNALDFKTKSHQKSTLKKLYPESKNSAKNIEDKTTMSRLISKPISKTAVKVEKKNSQLSDLRKTKEMPTIDKIPLHLLNLQKIKITPREISKTTSQTIPEIDKSIPQVENSIKKVIQKEITEPLNKVFVPDQKLQSTFRKLTPSIVSSTSLNTFSQSDHQKTTLKMTPKSSASKILSNAQINDYESPLHNECHENKTPQSPKPKFFLTPGKSSKSTAIGRKKPQLYFMDEASQKTTPLKSDYNNVKSPISLYIHGTDTDLIQNVHGRINDRLLTPISSKKAGNSPRLKFTLSSKENKSPTIKCNENIILPTVRYQSAKNFHLIDEKSSYSPSSLTPNSKTKKLLGPIENTVVIRHKGRVLDYSPQSDYVTSETSVLVQKMAEKMISTRKKCI